MPRLPRFLIPALLLAVLVAAVFASQAMGGQAPPAPAAGVSAGPAATAHIRLPSPCGSRARRPANIKHIIVIVFENKSPKDVYGKAPYLTALAKRCGTATNFHAEGHPSLPNYLAMTSGSTYGLHKDCSPQSCSQSATSIFAQLVARHRLWQAFQQSMPHRCDLDATNLYAPRHNPAVYYKHLRASGSCAAHDQSLGSPAQGNFHKALNHTLGSFVFVTPNICDDMHSCSVTAGDAWLRTWIPVIRSSRVYRAGHTAIVITFDEGGGSDNQIPTLVVSPYIRAGFRSSRSFTHYSLLHACEFALGIHAFLGSANGADGFGTAFKLR
jgi:phosphatidylinositol-3-phosphatase